MSLQNELTRTLNVVEALADTERAKVDAQVDRITAMENDLRANMPISPNMMMDTRKFDSLCAGLKETPMSFVDGAFGGPWVGAWQSGSEGTCTVEVLRGKPSVLKSRGLDPTGTDMMKLIGDDRSSSGVDAYTGGDSWCVAVFDIESTAPRTGNDHTYFTIGNGPANSYVGYNVDLPLQSSVFHCMMEYVGSEEAGDAPGGGGVKFNENTVGGIKLSKENLGQGWLHGKTSRSNNGGDLLTRVHLPVGGRMKFAMALPYTSFGDHGDRPVWLDWMGDPSSRNLGHYISEYSA